MIALENQIRANSGDEIRSGKYQAVGEIWCFAFAEGRSLDFANFDQRGCKTQKL